MSSLLVYTIKMISNTSRYAYINTIAGMISYFPRRQFIERDFLNWLRISHQVATQNFWEPDPSLKV